jgi:hypothetical protein
MSTRKAVCARPGCGKPLPPIAITHDDPYCSRGCANFEWVTGPALREALRVAEQEIRLPEVDRAYVRALTAAMEAYEKGVRDALGLAVSAAERAFANEIKGARRALRASLGAKPADDPEEGTS